MDVICQKRKLAPLFTRGLIRAFGSACISAYDTPAELAPLASKHATNREYDRIYLGFIRWDSWARETGNRYWRNDSRSYMKKVG